MALAFMWESSSQQRTLRYEAPPAAADPSNVGEAGVTASAVPVPPLDLPHYHGDGLEAGIGIESGASASGASPKEVTGA